MSLWETAIYFYAAADEKMGINPGLSPLRGEHMVADARNHRPAVYPFVGGFGRVVVIDGSAAGIPAVEGVLRGTAGDIGNGLVELPVVQCGKGARLIEHAGYRVGERGVAHPVEDTAPTATWPE